MTQRNGLKTIVLVKLFVLTLSLSIAANEKQSGEEKTQKFFLGQVVSVGDGQMVIENQDKQITLFFNPSQFQPSFVGFRGLGQAPRMPAAGHHIKARFSKDHVLRAGLFSPGFPALKTIENRHKLSVQELFDAADENQDGKVDYVEYATWIFQSVKHLPDKYSKRLDKNGDDILDLSEFEAALELLAWYRISRQSPAEWIASHDADNSGELEIEETKGLVIIGHSGDVEAKRIRAFKRLDSDQSGGLTAAEFEPEYQQAVRRRN